MMAVGSCPRCRHRLDRYWHQQPVVCDGVLLLPTGINNRAVLVAQRVGWNWLAQTILSASEFFPCPLRM